MWDYDLPAVYREMYPVAKKEHFCCECGGKILPGEKYQLVTGCWDHQWFTFKTCERCKTQRDELAAETMDAPAPFGELEAWCINSDVAFWNDQP